MRTLVTELAFPESARWHDGRLWLANWGAQEILAIDPDGHSQVITRVPTTLPISIDWLPDGRLLIVSGPESLLVRMEPDGSLVTHADLKSLSDKGWNEIVVDGRGNTYVNGGGFDMMAGEEFAPGGVALLRPDGSLEQVADGIAFPNGMAIMPDNSTLIVAESYARRLTAFDIETDGALSNRRMWAELGDGVPDGICIDAEGTVWYADVPNRRCSRVREGGELLETHQLDRGAFACMLGGDDGTTLFVLAAEWNGPGAMFDAARTGQVLTAEAPAPHAGWP
jgi:sugar lactone lactonase YvrE